MKRIILTCLIVAIYLLQVNCALANPTNVSWDYWSPLEVRETIENIGGGLYKFSTAS